MIQKMRILILNWRDLKHPEGGGAEVHLFEIFKRLVKRGHEVVLLTTKFTGAAERDEYDGVTILRLGSTFLFNWEAPGLIRRVLKDFKADIIIDDVNKIPFFTPCYFKKPATAVFFHHLFGRTIFDLTIFPFALYVLGLERLSGLLYRTTPCCTVSPSTRGELLKIGFNASNITVIENSVDTELYSPNAAIEKDPDLLLFTGRLKSYKNVSMLLDALKILSDRGRILKLSVVGSGDDETALRRKVENYGLTDRVTFEGFVSEARKVELYCRATLFVNPSLKEGWGITNVEANACGTAVVANDAHGIRDAVRHGETGLLYKENDINSLIESIEHVLDNKDLRTKLIDGGLRWAHTFSWNSSADKMEQWLWQIISKK